MLKEVVYRLYEVTVLLTAFIFFPVAVIVLASFN